MPSAVPMHPGDDVAVFIRGGKRRQGRGMGGHTLHGVGECVEGAYIVQVAVVVKLVAKHGAGTDTNEKYGRAMLADRATDSACKSDVALLGAQSGMENTGASGAACVPHLDMRLTAVCGRVGGDNKQGARKLCRVFPEKHAGNLTVVDFDCEWKVIAAVLSIVLPGALDAVSVGKGEATATIGAQIIGEERGRCFLVQVDEARVGPRHCCVARRVVAARERGARRITGMTASSTPAELCIDGLLQRTLDGWRATLLFCTEMI